MSSAAEEAAAALIPGMVGQLVNAMPLAGEDLLAADLEARRDAAVPTPAPSSQPQPAPVAAAPAPAAAPVQADPVVEEALDLEPRISEDLQALLDEPDFEEEAALEVQGRIDDDEIDYSTDPEVAKRLTALERENRWLKDQRVVSDKKKWIAENLKAYPLLQRYAPDEVAKIDATSRRAFARAAAGLNTRFSTMLKPALDDIEEKRKQLRGEVDQTVRAEYRDNGWGTITAGPGVTPVEAAEQSTEYSKAMKSGNLPKAIGALLRGAGVNQQ